MNQVASRRAIIWLCLAALCLLFVVSTPAAACPTCKDSLSQTNPHQQNLARGYFYSILFMMSMPFILLGSFSLYMWIEIRRARAREAAGAASEAKASSLEKNSGALPSPGG